MRNQNVVSSVIVVVIMIVFVCAAIFGYVANLLYIWKETHLAITVKFILSIAGVFVPPLGALLGYF